MTSKYLTFCFEQYNRITWVIQIIFQFSPPSLSPKLFKTRYIAMRIWQLFVNGFHSISIPRPHTLEAKNVDVLRSQHKYFTKWNVCYEAIQMACCFVFGFGKQKKTLLYLGLTNLYCMIDETE